MSYLADKEGSESRLKDAYTDGSTEKSKAICLTSFKICYYQVENKQTPLVKFAKLYMRVNKKNIVRGDRG